MEKLIQSLQTPDLDVRITSGTKWLVFYDEEWTVFDRPYNAKKNRVVFRGNRFDDAIENLIKKPQYDSI